MKKFYTLILICILNNNLYAVEINPNRLERSALNKAAEILFGEVRMHYATLENILYLQHLDEHPEILPKNRFWSIALEQLALHKLLENCVNIGLISEEEREDAFRIVRLGE